jgi:hypothetical protein
VRAPLATLVSTKSVKWTGAGLNADTFARRPRTMMGTTMSKFLDRLRERTGIYSLGFDPASFLGIAVTVGFVVVVGGALAFLVSR